MNCPGCNSQSRVTKTVDVLGVIVRKHECKCGASWATEETVRKGTYTAANSRIPPPTVVTNPPAPVTEAGGNGGALPSGSDLPDSAPDPSRQSDQEESPARAFVYPAAFESAWNATAKTGSKYAAFKAWRKHGKPAALLVAQAWRRWAQLDQWKRGIVPHVSTWLNGRCWEQLPSEVVKMQPARNGAATERVQRSTEVAATWALAEVAK